MSLIIDEQERKERCAKDIERLQALRASGAERIDTMHREHAALMEDYRRATLALRRFYFNVHSTISPLVNDIEVSRSSIEDTFACSRRKVKRAAGGIEDESSPLVEFPVRPRWYRSGYTKSDQMVHEELPTRACFEAQIDGLIEVARKLAGAP